MRKIMILFSATLLLLSCGNSTKPETQEKAETTADEKTEVTANAQEVVTEEVSYEADGVTMKGFIAYKPGEEKSKPGVLVVHEWWGHNEHARNKAKALADLGYVAIAVDMYGEGKQAAHPDDAGKFAGMVMQNIDGAKARFESALTQLKANKNVNPEKIGAIGFCFGGSVVMTMANMGMDLDAVAAFHSGVALPVMPKKGKLHTPILVCNGAEDPFVKEEQKVTFKEMMDESGVEYKYIDYPGAVHAFTNPGADEMGKKFNLPLAYNKEADEQSWNEMKMFFEKFLN